jgi:hypothetical protein
MTTTSDPMSLSWVCEHYPERVQRLFAALNLELPALAAVSVAVRAQNWLTACAALVGYYRTCESGQWLRHAPLPPGDGTIPAVEKMAHASFPTPDGDIPVPRLPSGAMNWGYVPQGRGGDEWVYGINRHDYMTDMVAAFVATGNRRYAEALNEQLGDWVRSISVPEEPDNQGPCPWGTILEVGHRSKVWPGVFYGLQPYDEFTSATRILVLCQALDHAEFLFHRHSNGSNWVITEMSGLLSIACGWPEFREADTWRELALRLCQDELKGQVYPDGVQKELSSNYQMAVLWHLDFFIATMHGAGISIAPDFAALLERMWNYLAYSLCPNGYSPHNGDSDRPTSGDPNQVIAPLPVVKPLLAAAEVHRRPDWVYIATNGSRGERPEGLPSARFPWGGQLISRSGWEADAHWSYFDAGPWGILHQQFDALHLSITACGRDLLVDSGRYTYQNYFGEAGTWRSYFIGTAAHNTVLIDGLGQVNGPQLVDAPLDDTQMCITQTYDYAQATYYSGYADVATAFARHKAVLWRQMLPEEGVDYDVSHTRGVLYLRGMGWVVVDRIATDRPRRITPLWHFHPACTVIREGQSVVTVDEGVGNLRIQPVGTLDWEIEFISGRESPDFQGWYSTEMDVKVPNICACYTAEIEHTTTFAWVLLPAKGPVPAAEVEILDITEDAVHLLLHIPGVPAVEVAIRLDDDVTGHCTVQYQ